jgi:hypothetical protein
MIFIRVSHIKCRENLVKSPGNKNVNRQGCSKGISLEQEVTATSHSKVSIYQKLLVVNTSSSSNNGDGNISGSSSSN